MEPKQEVENNEKSLHALFLEGWNGYEELEITTLAFNSTEFQNKVKTAMKNFEETTRIVSELGVFSSNELIDEVSTESLRYMLLPFFLGKLALKLHQRDRAEVLQVAEVYFKDYLQRCQEYGLCDSPKNNANDNTNATGDNAASNNELAELLRAAHSRNDKIAQFRRKKELEEQIKLMKEAVKNDSVDEEVKREFFMNYLKRNIIEANEELDSIKMEKQLVGLRQTHISADSDNSAGESSTAHKHGHGHSHGPHSHAPPKRQPLQPFIITRDATQKAVFGLGYPSLPVMTVGEFYEQRVQEGIFPDEEKVAKMNAAQAMAAAQDPNEKEDMEKAIVEQQIESDDPEYIARMRRMDEYKDVVRRGDGNRHNRS